MQVFMTLVAAFIFYECLDFIPDRVKEWWQRSKLRKWSYPVLVIVITVAVLLGIHYGVLHISAIIIPTLIVLPFAIGIVWGICRKIKNAGERMTLNGATEAFDIAVKCLSELGCQPKIDKDGSIDVSYQGEKFHIDFGGMYAQVWDLTWAGVKADDPDMPKIREAVNVANFNFGPTVVMTAPNDEGVIGFHSRCDIMLHPACPDNVPFVKAVLDSFFDAKERVRNSFQQISANQTEMQRGRRPVGFTTDTE